MSKYFYFNIVFALCLFNCGCNVKNNSPDKPADVPKSYIAKENEVKLLLDKA